MTARRAERVVRVFYRDLANGVAVPSSRPEALMASRLVPLVERLLHGPDDFIGIVDRNDVVLQAYIGQDADEMTLELIHPEARGCRRLTLARAAALRLLQDLPERFDQSLLPGADYVE
jgi:hypothetical protein